MKILSPIAVLLVLLFAISTTQAQSEISFEGTLEIELRDGLRDESVHEFGRDGFVLLAYERNLRKTNWVYRHYDTDLKLTETTLVEVEGLQLDNTIFNGDQKLHNLYLDPKGKYSLVTYDLKSKEINKVDGVLPKRCVVNHLSVLGDQAYFVSNIKRSPFLFTINWKTGEKKQIPISIPSRSPKALVLDNLQLVEKSNEVFVYVQHNLSRKANEYYVIRLDAEGNKIGTLSLSKNHDKNILDASAHYIGDDEYLFLGTYSSKRKGFSDGLFFSRLKGETISNLKFHNYIDLKQFINNEFSDKRVARLEARSEKKKAQGKDFSLNYAFVIHDIITTPEGEFVFLGEAYYATYERTSYMVTDSEGRTTRETTSTFDGFQFTDALLVKFDPEGNVIWNQSFNMWPTYKPFRLKKFITLLESNDEDIEMMYVNDFRIHNTVVDNEGKITTRNESEKIESDSPADKAKGIYEGKIDFWYDNVFIAYGAQKLKNRNTQKKRKIYYVSKVVYK